MLWVLIRITSTESPHRGDSNEYPQHMFLWRTDENYPSLIIKYPPYLFFWTADLGLKTCLAQNLWSVQYGSCMTIVKVQSNQYQSSCWTSASVMILSFWTDRPGDQTAPSGADWSGSALFAGLHCLPFRLHLLDTLLYGKTTLFICLDNYCNFFKCMNFFWFFRKIYQRVWKLYQYLVLKVIGMALREHTYCLIHGVQHMVFNRFHQKE